MNSEMRSMSLSLFFCPFFAKKQTGGTSPDRLFRLVQGLYRTAAAPAAESSEKGADS